MMDIIRYFSIKSKQTYDFVKLLLNFYYALLTKTHYTDFMKEQYIKAPLKALEAGTKVTFAPIKAGLEYYNQSELKQIIRIKELQLLYRLTKNTGLVVFVASLLNELDRE